MKPTSHRIFHPSEYYRTFLGGSVLAAATPAAAAAARLGGRCCPLMPLVKVAVAAEGEGDPKRPERSMPFERTESEKDEGFCMRVR